jgi:hypothetical protein
MILLIFDDEKLQYRKVQIILAIKRNYNGVPISLSIFFRLEQITVIRKNTARHITDELQSAKWLDDRARMEEAVA